MAVSMKLMAEDADGSPVTVKVPLPVTTGSLTPVGDAQITVGATAVGLGTIPAGARVADVQLDGAVRFRVTGAAPTVSVGQRESVGMLVDTPLGDFRMIRAGGADVTADVVFYA